MCDNRASTSIEKLKGRENFDTWKVAIKSYLIIKKLWQVIEEDISPDSSPNTNAQAISELTLSIENTLYNYIEDSKSASVVWKSLLKAFDDSGVARKVTILNQLVSIRLKHHKSMEKYINAILLNWNKTKTAGFSIEEQVIASLMLGGLPEEYRAMILGIENSGKQLTVDYVKTVLLQGIPDPFETEEDKAMPLMIMKGGHKTKGKKGWKGKRRCFKCGDVLHMLIDCPKKDLKCHECGDVRHLVARCPRRKHRKSYVREPKQKEETKTEKTMIAFFTNGNKETIKDEWFIDSGATAHVCNNKEYFEKLEEGKTDKEILVANNSKVKVHGTGTVKLVIGNETVVLKKVSFAPQMCTNLISVRRITENGYEVLFTQGECKVMDKNESVVMKGRLLDGMYRVKAKSTTEMVCFSREIENGIDWHRKLGHPGYASMRFLNGKEENFSLPDEKCKVCVMGKQTRVSYKAQGKKNNELLGLIHTDVNGPMPVESIGGHRYFVSFIDDYSKKVFLYPIKLKSEVYDKMVHFKNLVENQLGKKIKAVKSDNGTEFVNKQMEELFTKSGIIHQKTIPYTPQQNGVVERYNRTIMERVRCMLLDAKLNDDFWAEAAQTAVYLLNAIPKGNDLKSANELWDGKQIDLKKLRLFGETAMIHVPKEKRKKLDDKSEEGIFLGYEQNGYRIYNKTSKKVVIAKDVIFLGSKAASNSDTEKEKCLAVKEAVLHYGSTVIPYTYAEAMTSPEAEKWVEAMQEEYASLMENDTWILEDLPPGKRAIKCKWVFATKEGVDGQIIRYKARLVGKGFSQIEGIDYHETYSPVIRYNSIRMMIAIAAHLDLKISQMDAVTAFLNGKLNEEIFMEQPEHFNDGSEKCCKLIKSIYGLKQSSRIWNETLNEALMCFGLIRSNVDQCLYHMVKNEQILIVAIYVDDILIFSNQEDLEKEIKISLKSKFKMKDMGEVASILGIRVIRDRNAKTISLDQTAYVNRILKRFSMQNCNAVSSPLEAGQRISKEMCAKSEAEKQAMVDVPYRQAIGSLMFLAQITRPDISFPVNLLSRYCESPGMGHWGAVKRILRYIKGTMDYKIMYDGNKEEILYGFSDADWAADLDQRRSTTGYVFTLCGAAISWACKRQSTVALSSTEAEYMATVATIQEAIWLKSLHNEVFADWEFVKIFCDNKGAIMVLNNNSYSSRTKHIDIKIKFIREHIENKNIELEYLPTTDMPADILTKNVGAKKIFGHLPNIGLSNVK